MIDFINSSAGSWIGGIFLGLIIYKLYLTAYFLIIDTIGVLKTRQALDDMGVKNINMSKNPRAMYFLYKSFLYSKKLNLSLHDLNKESDNIDMANIYTALNESIMMNSGYIRRISGKSSNSQ